MAASMAVIDAVSQRLDSFADLRRAESSEMGPEAVDFVQAGIDALRGGKRLRARFLHTGWRTVAEADGRSADPGEAVVASAAALEVFHVAALVHDDLIDNSDTRRGRPAAHRLLEAAYRDRGWRGDAGAFGRSAAILLGDLLLGWSDDLLEDGLGTVPADRAAQARTLYGRMRRGVTVGQYLDVAEESAWATTPDDEHAARALRVARFKSARYSVQQPLLIGAALAGADAGQTAALAAFGEPLGLAFQLRDDVLGVFGDASVTGKPAGDDLREGKRTVLIALARERLPAGGRHVVDELLGDPGLDQAQIATLQRTVIDSGALDRVEDLITRYVREADRALSGAQLGNAAVGELRDLARAATARTS
ncbi:polyprenyl synthetase family protein [Microbacterium sp.]|uniref:polyprenyl synthetase family protein n=1 Tax=Microbacterium sp. TaxID=51671 RepID=UPI0037CA26BB